jgi:hypothetical protein
LDFACPFAVFFTTHKKWISWNSVTFFNFSRYHDLSFPSHKKSKFLSLSVLAPFSDLSIIFLDISPLFSPTFTLTPNHFHSPVKLMPIIGDEPFHVDRFIHFRTQSGQSEHQHQPQIKCLIDIDDLRPAVSTNYRPNCEPDFLSPHNLRRSKRNTIISQWKLFPQHEIHSHTQNRQLCLSLHF